MQRTNCEAAAISLLLRLAVASLFIAAVIPKYLSGFDAIAGSIQGAFKDSWLPASLVMLHARIIPYIETLIPVWLIVGYQLRYAWLVTGLFLTSLAFGMLVVQQGAVAGTNYLYVLLACAGLYFSPLDRLSVDGLLRKNQEA